MEKTRKLRPAPCGVSVGHYRITAGTLGCLVLDILRKAPAILSNNHVLANCNEAAIGDLITQPGPYDVNANYPGRPLEEFRIAALARFVPIRWATECPFRKAYFRLLGKVDWENLVDSAIAYPEERVVPKMFTDGLVPDGAISPKELEVGMTVRKDGRTTCLTKGSVGDIYWSGYVWYGTRRAYFTDQMAIHQPGFSAGGDSGSLVTTIDGRAVGLLFAGSYNVTIANKIWNVERLLKVRIPRKEYWREMGLA